MSSTENNGEELTVFAPSIEQNVVGTWFARLGVLALLIGAAFGYRYAVDQGLIGPEARVALGTMSGFALIGWGGWAHRKGWANFSHAISAGGVAVLYLSVLAAQFRFDLISPSLALTLLSGVALLSVWLAISYDSLPLAILATVGAFMNPYFMAAKEPVAAMNYVVGVDIAVVVLAFYKRWGILDKLALAATTYFVARSILTSQPDGPSVVEGIAYMTVLWMLFTLIPFIQAVRDGTRAGAVDVGLIVSVGFLYVMGGLLDLFSYEWRTQGFFVLAVGIAYGVIAAASHFDERTRSPLGSVTAALSVAFITLSVPFIFEGSSMYLTWAVEGAVLLYVGGLIKHTFSKIAGAGLSVVGLIGTIQTLATYSPEEFLVSPDSVVIVIEVLTLFATAWVIDRFDDSEDWSPTRNAVLVTATMLCLGWLSREASFEVVRQVDPARVYETTQFTLSALWGSFATVLIAIGIAVKQKWARLLGLGILSFTIVKMVTVDLWALEVLQRTIAFIGLGVVMIGFSFVYNRFRELIVGSEG